MYSMNQEFPVEKGHATFLKRRSEVMQDLTGNLICKEEVIGQSVYNFVDKRYHKILTESVNYVFETGKTTSYESFAGDPSDFKYYFINFVSSILKKGKVTKVSINGIDITEQRKAKSRFKNIFDNANDAILLINKNGKIEEVNQYCTNFFGYKKSDLEGIDLPESVSLPDLCQFTLQHFHRLKPREINRRINAGDKSGKCRYAQHQSEIGKLDHILDRQAPSHQSGKIRQA